MRYGDRGGGAYHAISNQIWLWNIALTLALIPLIGVLFVLYSDLVAEERWRYLFSYISVPIGIAAIQIVLFWIGNRVRPYPPAPFPDTGARGDSANESFASPRIGGGRVGARIVALHLLIFSDCAMIWLFSLLIGAAGGIHFIFPAALALPFYFFRREIQARAWITKAIWVGVIVAQFVFALIRFHPSPQGGEGMGVGFFPLPPQVTQIARVIIVALAALIAVIWVVYFWWQLSLTKRLFNIWERASLWGVPTSMQGRDRKSMILLNRAMYISIAWTQVLMPAALAIFAILAFAKGEKNIIETGMIFIWAPIALTVEPIIFILIKKFKPHFLYPNHWFRDWGMIAALAAVGGYIFWLSICLPFKTLVHLFFIAHASSFLILKQKIDSKPETFIGFSIPLVFYLGVYYWHQNSQPLGMIWPWLILPLQVTSLASFGMAIILFFFYTRSEGEKAEKALEVAHAESEKLLLNILPAEVSHELKSHGHTTPREYSSATVLFTDFVGFTRIAEKLTAVDLVRELDQCFSYFDNVAHKYGLEKLKTIGDAYMAAGGIPVENNTHPIDCALAALEIQAFMNQMKDIKAQQGLPYWELRLGMHTGPLVAGVVGEKKFAYDVWGDTVNTASRMESSGLPGAINISRELYDRLRFLFACEYRGKVYAKNKGEIEMYFLRGLKPKFSTPDSLTPLSAGRGGVGGGVGRVPNGEFKEIYEKIKRGAKLVARK